MWEKSSNILPNKVLLFHPHNSWGTNARGFCGLPLSTNFYPHEPIHIICLIFIKYISIALATKLRPNEPGKFGYPRKLTPPPSRNKNNSTVIGIRNP